MQTKLPEIQKSYINGLFGQLHIRESVSEVQNKIPVMCLHASPLSGLIYEELLVMLGQDRHTIAPDTPGYGMSDPPLMQPNIEYYAEAFYKLLDTLKIDTLDLVGYATGSVIAIALADLCPDRIRRMVLFSAPVFTDEDRNSFQGRFGEIIIPEPSGKHLLPLWHQVYDGRGPGQTLDLCMHVFSEHIRASTDAKPWAPRAAFEYKLDQTLNRIKQPLVIYNLPNEVFESTERAGKYINNGSLISLNDWGHGFLQTKTNDTNILIRKFFECKEPKVGR